MLNRIERSKILSMRRGYILNVLALFLVSCAPQEEVKTEKRIGVLVNYLVDKDLKSLQRDADAIVIGSPITSFKGKGYDVQRVTACIGYPDFTLTKIKIHKWIKKGKFKGGDELEVNEPISLGEQDGRKVVFSIEGYDYLRKGEKYIINMNEGKFNIRELKGEKVKVSKHEYRQPWFNDIKKQIIKEYADIIRQF